MVVGKITQVIGPVVDVDFPPGQLPKILNALRVSNPSISDAPDNLVLEVRDTGKPIMMPVGPECLGRILNVVGNPVDEAGPVVTEKHLTDPAPATAFAHLDATTVLSRAISELGIAEQDFYMAGGIDEVKARATRKAA